MPSKESITPRFADSKLRIIEKFVVFPLNETVMTSWKVISCSREDPFQLAPNYCPAPTEDALRSCKFFMMDVQDFNKLADLHNGCENEKEGEEMIMSFIRSLTDCVKLMNQKRIYLRTLPPAKFGSNDPPRVFSDDILEVIPIILQRQKIPGLLEKFEKYRKKWQNKGHLYTTVELSKFEKILEQFDCDKDLITIIDDPTTIATRDRMMERGGYIRTFSWDTKVVTNVYQAVRFVFRALVNGRNWKTDRCPDHENCIVHLKKKIVSELKELISLTPGTYINTDYLIKTVEKVQNECPHTYKPSLDVELEERPSEEIMEDSHYHRIAKYYELPVYENFLKNGEKGMEAWMMKCFVQLGWIQNFFTKNETNGLKEVMINVMMFEVPVEHQKEMIEFLNSTIRAKAAPAASSSSKKLSAVETLVASIKSESPITVATKKTAFAKDSKGATTLSKNHSTPISEDVQRAKEFEPNVLAKKSATSTPVPTGASVKSSEESSRPSKKCTAVPAPIAPTASIKSSGGSSGSSKIPSTVPSPVAPKAKDSETSSVLVKKSTASSPVSPGALTKSSGAATASSKKSTTVPAPIAPTSFAKDSSTSVAPGASAKPTGVSTVSSKKPSTVPPVVAPEASTKFSGVSTMSSKKLTQSVAPTFIKKPFEVSCMPSGADKVLSVPQPVAPVASIKFSNSPADLVKKSPVRSKDPNSLVNQKSDTSPGKPSKTEDSSIPMTRLSDLTITENLEVVSRTFEVQLAARDQEIAHLKSQISTFQNNEAKLTEANERLSRELWNSKCLSVPKPYEELVKKMIEMDKEMKKLQNRNLHLEATVRNQ